MRADVLAGRKPAGRASGRVLLCGEPARPGRSRRLVAYAEQADSLLENLTPREMLTYTAAMGGREPQPALAARVAEVR